MLVDSLFRQTAYDQREALWGKLLDQKIRLRPCWQPENGPTHRFDVWLGRDRDDLCTFIGCVYRCPGEGNRSRWEAHVAPTLEPSWEAQTLGVFDVRAEAARQIKAASLKHGHLARLRTLVVHPLAALAEVEVE